LNEKIINLNNNVKNLETSNKNNETTILELKLNIETKERKNNELVASLNNITKENEKLNSHINEIKINLNEKQEKIKKDNETINNLNIKTEKLQMNCDEITDMYEKELINNNSLVTINNNLKLNNELLNDDLNDTKNNSDLFVFEVLGCGGTLIRFQEIGATIAVLFMGEGIAARFPYQKSYNSKSFQKMTKIRMNGSKKAMKVLGVKNYQFGSRYCGQFDNYALISITKEIENKLQEFKPDILLTHSPSEVKYQV
jgi:hypothetical protein